MSELMSARTYARAHVSACIYMLNFTLLQRIACHALQAALLACSLALPCTLPRVLCPVILKFLLKNKSRANKIAQSTVLFLDVSHWRADREAEGARLLSEYRIQSYLGFESPALRQIMTSASCILLVGAFLLTNSTPVTHINDEVKRVYYPACLQESYNPLLYNATVHVYRKLIPCHGDADPWSKLSKFKLDTP